MDIVEMVVQILAGVAGAVAALVSGLILVKFRWPAALWFVLKLFASALSPWFALTGVVTTAVGLLTGSFLLVVVGVYTLAFFAIHIFRVTRPPDHSTDFEQAFGPRWDKQISSAQGMLFLRRRSPY